MLNEIIDNALSEAIINRLYKDLPVSIRTIEGDSKNCIKLTNKPLNTKKATL